jgi:hypothetical protein
MASAGGCDIVCQEGNKGNVMQTKTLLSLALAFGALVALVPAASSAPLGAGLRQATENAGPGIVEEVRHRKWRKHRHFGHRHHWRRFHAHRHWRHRHRHRHFFYYPYYSYYGPYYYYPYRYHWRPGFSIHLHF